MDVDAHLVSDLVDPKAIPEKDPVHYYIHNKFLLGKLRFPLDLFRKPIDSKKPSSLNDVLNIQHVVEFVY